MGNSTISSGHKIMVEVQPGGAGTSDASFFWTTSQASQYMYSASARNFRNYNRDVFAIYYAGAATIIGDVHHSYPQRPALYC